MNSNDMNEERSAGHAWQPTPEEEARIEALKWAALEEEDEEDPTFGSDSAGGGGAMDFDESVFSEFNSGAAPHVKTSITTGGGVKDEGRAHRNNNNNDNHNSRSYGGGTMTAAVKPSRRTVFSVGGAGGHATGIMVNGSNNNTTSSSSSSPTTVDHCHDPFLDSAAMPALKRNRVEPDHHASHSPWNAVKVEEEGEGGERHCLHHRRDHEDDNNNNMGEAMTSNLATTMNTSAQEKGRGVLDLPPLDCPSIMVCGDNGTVRWVTLRGRPTAPAPAARAPPKRRDPNDQDDDEDEEQEQQKLMMGVVERPHGEALLDEFLPAWHYCGEDSEDDRDTPHGFLPSASFSPGEPQAYHAPGTAGGVRESWREQLWLSDGTDGCTNITDLKAKVWERLEQQMIMVQQQQEEQQRQRREAEGAAATAAASKQDHSGDVVLPGVHALSASSLSGEYQHSPMMRRMMLDTSSSSSSGIAGPSSHNSAPAVNRGDDDGLLVTRFRPRVFRELLSDETLNLRLLQWLQSWSPYVFGYPAVKGGTQTSAVAVEEEGQEGRTGLDGADGDLNPNEEEGDREPGKDKTTTAEEKTKNALLADPQHNNHHHHHSSSTSSSGGERQTTTTTTASTRGSVSHLPEDRLVVLAGPPGCGKTVLVHVLAAHCGYELLEVNASSERTTSRLQSVIQMVSSSGIKPRAAAPPQRSSAPNRHNNNNNSNSFLVQQLLRPKCLLLDEMDGLTADVVDYLLQQDLRRPVFCVCNDLYAPSLRRLRYRYGHAIFHVQPIRPQRLLARLEEVVFKAAQAQQAAAGKAGAGGGGFASLDQGTLAEVVWESDGDIRSCLNTLQFLQLRSSSSSSSSSSTLALRKQLERDKQVHYVAACSAYLQKMPRHQAITQLRQEYGLEYDALVTQGAEALRAQRKRRPGGGDRGPIAPSSHPYPPAVAPGFRVDPGFLYLLRRASSSQLSHLRHTLVDGLFECYLEMEALLDYTLEYSYRVAAAFSFQDRLTQEAYASTQSGGGGGGAESLLGFADRYELEVTCQTLYAAVASCGSAKSLPKASSRGGGTAPAAALMASGIHYPQDGYQLQRLQAQCAGVAGALRERCRGAGRVIPYWQSEEVYCSDWCPYVLHCLYDRALRMQGGGGGGGGSGGAPRKWTGSATTMLPPAIQTLVHQTVERHVAYGLTYRPPPTSPSAAFQSSSPSSAAGGGGGATAAGEGAPAAPYYHHNTNSSAGGGGGGGATAALWAKPSWALDPEVEAVGSLQRHFTSAYAGFRSRKAPAMLTSSSRHHSGNHSSHSHNGGGNVSHHRGAGGGGFSLLPPSPLFFVKDDLRQYIVSEIQRSVILLHHSGRSKKRSSIDQSADPRTGTHKQKTPGSPPLLGGAGAGLHEEGSSSTPGKEHSASLTTNHEKNGNVFTAKTEPGAAAAALALVPGPQGSGADADAGDGEDRVRDGHPVEYKKDFFGRLVPVTRTTTTSNGAASQKGSRGGMTGSLHSFFSGKKKNSNNSDAPEQSAGAKTIHNSSIHPVSPSNKNKKEGFPALSGMGGDSTVSILDLCAPGAAGPLVKYVYFDGATNAVKKPAQFDHF